MVWCKKNKQELSALKEAPICGPLGQIIWENVSEEAWLSWVESEIKIINEERLDLSEESAQQRLFLAMIDFLCLNDLVKL